MSDTLFTREQPIVAIDVNFSSINARYEKGDRAGQLILPNSRPGYIAARLAELGITSVFFQHDAPNAYGGQGLKQYITASDLHNPDTYEVHDLPPEQQLRPHAIRVRDGIDPDLHNLIPGYNSARFCRATRDRQTMQDWLREHRIGAIGVFGSFDLTTAMASGDTLFTVRPGEVGISREERVLSVEAMKQAAAGRTPQSVEGMVLMQHIEQAPFESVATALRAEEAVYDDNDRHNLVFYTHGTTTYAAELQKTGMNGGRWKTAELFYVQEVSDRLPDLWEQHQDNTKKIVRAFSARFSSYAISYQLGTVKGESGWYVTEVNHRPYTPDLGVGSERRQKIAESTVVAGEVEPLRRAAETAYDTRPNAFVAVYT